MLWAPQMTFYWLKAKIKKTDAHNLLIGKLKTSCVASFLQLFFPSFGWNNSIKQKLYILLWCLLWNITTHTCIRVRVTTLCVKKHAQVCVCVCAAVLRWNAWECPANQCLSRHHHVTCDLLESHTGTTITNTPHLGEESPSGEDKCVGKSARGPRSGEEDGTGGEGGCQSNHNGSWSTPDFCLFVFVCVCHPSACDGSDDNNTGPIIIPYAFR